MLSYKLSLHLLLICLCTSAFAQSTAGEPLFEKLTYRTPDGQEIPYRLLKPANMEKGRKYPLVVFIHGKDEAGRDNVSQLKNFVNSFTQADARSQTPCYVLAPQFAGYEEGTIGQQMVHLASLTRQVAYTENVADNQVYAVGVSRGAQLALKSVASDPKLFTAAAAIAGVVSYTDKEIKNLRKVAVGFFNGGQDPEIPAEYVHMMAGKLKARGVKVKHVEYADAHHLVWEKVARDKEFFNWLFSQKG